MRKPETPAAKGKDFKVGDVVYYLDGYGSSSKAAVVYVHGDARTVCLDCSGVVGAGMLMVRNIGSLYARRIDAGLVVARRNFARAKTNAKRSVLEFRKAERALKKLEGKK